MGDGPHGGEGLKSREQGALGLFEREQEGDWPASRSNERATALAKVIENSPGRPPEVERRDLMWSVVVGKVECRHSVVPPLDIPRSAHFAGCFWEGTPWPAPMREWGVECGGVCRESAATIARPG